MKEPLLEVKNLKVQFALRRGSLKAVDNLSLMIQRSETLGIVGETGCGKSVTALSILRLIPSPPGKITGGEIIFEGEDLLKKSEAEMQKIRGRKISMIFQEPMTSLNPSFTVGEQIAECYRIHLGYSRKEARDWTEHIFNAVRIPSPKILMACYPYELSGGMRQRVMVAMALACHPELLIADEPTTALDVTIQAEILELLRELQANLKMAMLFISHNLGVVARLCNRIAIMYAGSVVELAHASTLFAHPLHPYTLGLLSAIPRPALRQEQLRVIPGTVCDLMDPPLGCKFHPRCFKTEKICKREVPPLEEKAAGRLAACYFPEK